MWCITGILLYLSLQICIAQDCPASRRIEGFQCAGRGFDVSECPTGSRCMRDRSGGSFCCWDEPSAVEAPCEDPMTRGGFFVQCDRNSACPGRCHDCQVLQGAGIGLCCPQVTRQGCENSSPLRNEFEAARRRLQGPSAGSSSDTFGGGSTDTFGRGSTDTFGRGSGGEGFSFSMSGGSSEFGLGSVSSPDGFEQPTPFSGPGLTTMRQEPQPRPGMSSNPGIDFGMSLSDSRTSASRFSPASDGVPEVCPDGRPSSGRCIVGRPCGMGDTCVSTRTGGGVCCSFGSRALGGVPRMPVTPVMPEGPRDFRSSGFPGPSRSGAPMGRPGIMSGAGTPDDVARRRALLIRAEEARRRMAGSGGFSPAMERGPFMRRF